MAKLKRDMKKSGKTKDTNIPTDAITADLALSKDYQEYLKAHRARLGELERLASGRNLYEAP